MSPRTPSVPAGVRFAARAEIDTPLGTMTALATDDGLAALWFDFDEASQAALADTPVDAAHPHLDAARRWLAAYWSGEDPSPVEVPLDLRGTTFQRAVWRELRRIPRGQTRSYGEVAGALGGGAMARATGAACGANPVALIVPCHRVVGADGSLTGFAAGLPRKERLLQHEGVLLL